MSRRRSREEREEQKAHPPNCKIEKLKTLEIEEDLHDKVYSFLYTSSSESDYDDDNYSESGSETDKPETSGNTQSATIDACKCRDLNMNTITSDNVIELLKEVIDNTLREKIIQLATNNMASLSNIIERSKNEFEYSAPYCLSEVNNRLFKQHIICDHCLTQIEMEPPRVTKGRGKGNNPRGRERYSPSSSRSSYKSSSNTPIIQKGGMSLFNLNSKAHEAASSVHLEDIPENNPLYAQLQAYSQNKSNTFASIAKDDVDDIKSYEKI
ncbi:hypothetical protein H5410_051349 [Solanum commersonii]|uniref:Uncharacterized protein n=1 Tax=Solanum commersonii TaxID=4109 RepID=A0A9J5WY62_SOLCO|nr:hypothetical protein H5410_051349 [Solanum commersonii]